MSEPTEAVRLGLIKASQLREQGRVKEAIAAYREVLASYEQLPDSWYNLGFLLRQTGENRAALDAYAKALELGVQGAEEVHLNRAVIYSDGLRQPNAARKELDAALALNADYVPAMFNLANLHEDMGERDAARAQYEAILGKHPFEFEALARLAGLTLPAGADDEMIGRIRLALDSPRLDMRGRASLGFALARLLDAVGDHAAAFDAAKAANEASQKVWANQYNPYNRGAETAWTRLLAETYPTPNVPHATVQTSGPAPVFIVGMYRSGSTLVEQILASHPSVVSGGEMDLIPQVAQLLGRHPEKFVAATPGQLTQLAEGIRARRTEMVQGQTVLTDKRPDNFRHVGLIKQLFPKAKIIYTERDARDVAVSAYMLNLNPNLSWAFSLEDTLHQAAECQATMTLWKRLWPNDILTVNYETLVREVEGETRRMLDFLGLAMDPACLDFYKSGSPVRTASVWQVRQPVNDGSIGRWKNYERHFPSESSAH